MTPEKDNTLNGARTAEALTSFQSGDRLADWSANIVRARRRHPSPEAKPTACHSWSWAGLAIAIVLGWASSALLLWTGHAALSALLEVFR
ncbi:hypothetical protein KO516_21530 [Citreicella sp. C3M06]|uniref:hypothetical protein n=1 Tax=Citreicella sp. C3M06 TaxID=2841564 RepID=UPI001C09FF8C|nr:hypothetical protein [Citreicella sp. C3M06]MBU2963358.1 hypothetical protein [Citreicella sp. C3M06]